MKNVGFVGLTPLILAKLVELVGLGVYVMLCYVMLCYVMWCDVM